MGGGADTEMIGRGCGGGGGYFRVLARHRKSYSSPRKKSRSRRTVEKNLIVFFNSVIVGRTLYVTKISELFR